MNDPLRDTFVVEAVNLLDILADAREEHGKGCAAYPLSTSMIFKKMGPNLLVLVVDSLQPMVKIWNFGAIVGCGILLGVLILHIPLKVRNLLVFAHGGNRICNRISNFSNAFCNCRSHSNKGELMKKQKVVESGLFNVLGVTGKEHGIPLPLRCAVAPANRNQPIAQHSEEGTDNYVIIAAKDGEFAEQ